MRILVIEDDPQTIDLLVAELARDGHEVVGERTAAAGHRRATQETWDVIVSDIGLPDRSGFLLARQLREAGVDVPLIALSGYDTPEDRRNGLESGLRAPKTVTPAPLSPTAPRIVAAEQPVAVPAARRRGVLGGLVVVALGVPFVLQPLGVPNAASYLFIAMGLAFLISYVRGRQYVYLIPMVTLTSFGVGLLLPTWITMKPETAFPTFEGVIALGFVVAFALAPARRWPLVPAIVLGIVAASRLVTGAAIIPASLEPFLVPVVLIGVGAYLLAEPKS